MSGSAAADFRHERLSRRRANFFIHPGLPINRAFQRRERFRSGRTYLFPDETFSTFALTIGLIAAVPSTTTPQWKVGAASAKITPEKPMWMAGYAGRTKPSEGVEQDLFAKALVIEDLSGGRFALITMDLIGVPRDLRLNVAARLEKELGIPPASLAINASHTHSGPELRASKMHGVDDLALRQQEAAAYTSALEDTLIRLVAQAAKNSVPAHLDYSSASLWRFHESPHVRWQRRLAELPQPRWSGGSNRAGIESHQC